jgi:hypothetical protein
MTLEDIMNQWDIDCEINKDDISNESLNVPKLHNKYLRIHITEIAALKKYKIEYDKIMNFKWKYYNGLLTKEELIEYEIKPFQLKILKQDLPIYLNADEDLINTKLKMELQEEKVKFLENILKSIISRNFHIKNYIENQKFENGLM